MVMQVSDNLFYTYSQIYQLSYALPMYRSVGGTFVVKNLRKWIQFKKYMRGLSRAQAPKTLLGTPPVRKMAMQSLLARRGVLITPSVEHYLPQDKRIICIYTGHGSGDKPYLGDHIYDKMATFDYHFLTGPKNLEKLKDKSVALKPEKLIKIGNMRFDAYINGKIDAAKEQNRLGIRDRGLKNILYAPTWKWGQGSLLTHVHRFCHEISPHYNLIIRPHGHDRMKISNLRRWARKNHLKNVYFSNAANLAGHDTMRDFSVADLLISDRSSSIIYEFLITRKPIITIETNFSETHQMPVHLLIDNSAEPWNEALDVVNTIEKCFIEHGHKIAKYKRLLDSCFYFNDGKSTLRAVNFLKRLSKVTK